LLRPRIKAFSPSEIFFFKNFKFSSNFPGKSLKFGEISILLYKKDCVEALAILVGAMKLITTVGFSELVTGRVCAGENHRLSVTGTMKPSSSLKGPRSFSRNDVTSGAYIPIHQKIRISINLCTYKENEIIVKGHNPHTR
jgi:hypothetical protein